MLPWETLETATTPDGGTLTLAKRGDEYVLRVRGHVLMSSRMHGSEVSLAEAACNALASRDKPHVLIGGLGFGYTLRATLERLGPFAHVAVAELFAPIVAWNRGPVSALARAPLEDPRVSVIEGDVAKVMARASGEFDAILLDVDNGPSALSHEENEGLYSQAGLAMAYAALKGEGVLAVWSASADPAFARRMEKTGFVVQQLRPETEKKRTKHTLFLGRKSKGGGRRRR